MDLITNDYYELISTPEAVAHILLPEEQVLFSAKGLRDYMVATEKRIIIADKQGLTGRKVEFLTIPYKNVIAYSIETAGTFDLDSEIKLRLSNLVVEIKFLSGGELCKQMYVLKNAITKYILG